jgi:hypothetical protein
MQTIAYSRPMQYATLEVPVRKSALIRAAEEQVIRRAIGEYLRAS